MRKIHLVMDLETQEFQGREILERVIKTAIEKVFFVDVKITKLELEIEDDKPTERV